jgi:hypothetical protein
MRRIAKMKEEININGVKYVPASEALRKHHDGMRYCMVRTAEAGVFCGWLAERNGGEAKVLNARRIWYWEGAASLSQLAMDGTSKPENCKFPCEVPEVLLFGVIEIIPMTEKARESIAVVPVWTAD